MSKEAGAGAGGEAAGLTGGVRTGLSRSPPAASHHGPGRSHLLRIAERRPSRSEACTGLSSSARGAPKVPPFHRQAGRRRKDSSESCQRAKGRFVVAGIPLARLPRLRARRWENKP